MFFLQSCKDEIEDGGDVTPPDELADVKAIFEAKTFEGDTSTVFTMGERVTFFDLSEGSPDERTWSLPGASVNTSSRVAVPVIYPVPGTYDVTLKVKRSSDGQMDEITIHNFIKILSIPITPKFLVSVPEGVDGMITIKIGDKLTFEDASSGLPDSWSWEFPGSNSLTSTDKSPVVQYTSTGTFDVKLTASRDDAGSITSGDITKSSYINVLQRIVDCEWVLAGPNKIEILFTEPMMSDPSGAVGAFAMSSANASYSINSVTIDPTNNKKLILNYSGGYYGSDDASFTLTNDGSLKDATGYADAIDFNKGVIADNVGKALDYATWDLDAGKWKVFRGPGDWMPDNCFWSYSEERVFSGTKSFKYEWDASKLAGHGDVNADHGIKLDPYTLNAGDGNVVLYMRVFVEPGASFDNYNNQLICHSPWKVQGVNLEKAFNNPGQWVEIRTVMSGWPSMTNARLSYRFNKCENKKGTVYIDDIRFVPLSEDTRP